MVFCFVQDWHTPVFLILASPYLFSAPNAHACTHAHTYSRGVSQCCHHLDVSRSQLVNYRWKKRYNITQYINTSSSQLSADNGFVTLILCLTWGRHRVRWCKVRTGEVTSPVLPEKETSIDIWMHNANMDVRTHPLLVTDYDLFQCWKFQQIHHLKYRHGSTINYW